MRFFSYLIISLMFLLRCRDSKIKPQVDTNVSTKQIPSQESWNAQIIFSEEGYLKAILYADHLSVYEDKNQKLLEGVKIDFYDEEGIKSSSLTSKRGRIDDLSKDMYAIDSVVAVNDSGVVLTTDELIWKNKEKKIYTDKFVTIIDKNEKIEGYGFESDQQLNKYVIYNITYLTKINQTK